MLCCFCMWFMIGVFFFKQKTAYEMRISDWSSDVCSSDLRCSHPLGTIPISRWCRHEAVRDGVAPRRKPVDREPGSLAQQRGGVGICVPVVEQRERRRCERHDRVRAGVPAVWSAVSFLSRTMAALPLHLYRVTSGRDRKSTRLNSSH